VDEYLSLPMASGNLKCKFSEYFGEYGFARDLLESSILEDGTDVDCVAYGVMRGHPTLIYVASGEVDDRLVYGVSIDQMDRNVSERLARWDLHSYESMPEDMNVSDTDDFEEDSDEFNLEEMEETFIETGIFFDYKCSICLSEEPVCDVLTCCQHVFHFSCMQMAFAHDNRCPLCREMLYFLDSE
jgi:hypothetical protein